MENFTIGTGFVNLKFSILFKKSENRDFVIVVHLVYFFVFRNYLLKLQNDLNYEKNIYIF